LYSRLSQLDPQTVRKQRNRRQKIQTHSAWSNTIPQKTPVGQEETPHQSSKGQPQDALLGPKEHKKKKGRKAGKTVPFQGDR